MTLRKVPEAAAFMLSHALWERRLAAENPMTSPRPPVVSQTVGGSSAGGASSAVNDWDAAILQGLLLAWEQADTGNPGEAQQTLRRLLGQQPPEMGSHNGDRAAVLLRYTFDIDERTVSELQQAVLDDNSRLDLCRLLISDGEADRAVAVARTFRVFASYKANILADAANAQVLAGSADALSTAALAVQAAESTTDDDRLPDTFAEIACAYALADDESTADALFARATGLAAVGERQVAALSKIAVAQARAKWPDAAVATIGSIITAGGGDNLQDEDHVGEALEACAVAFAQEGRFSEAADALDRLGRTYTYRTRTMAAVAGALTTSGQIDRALNMIHEIPAGGRDGALAQIAPLLARAGLMDESRRTVGMIENPEWRADALVEIMSAPEARDWAAEPATTAIDAIPGGLDRPRLLARYAVTRDAPERDDLIQRAADLAASLDDKDARWRSLAEVAIVQSQAGLPAGGTFAAARTAALACDDDPWTWGRELWQLGGLQAKSGIHPAHVPPSAR